MTRAFLTAEWRYLVMLNWRIDPAILLPHVPAGTLIEPWRGKVWISLVGFRFLRTRVLGVPLPGHTAFPEINLRFYVQTATGRRGVVFLKEIVPRRAITLVARSAYNEPYVTRPMRADAPREPQLEPGRIRYAWRHHGRWNVIGAETVGRAVPMDGPDSHESFIAEHYWGYTRQRDGSTIEYEVEHPPWRAWPVRDVEFAVDVAAEYGPMIAAALKDRPATAFIADGSPIRVGRPRSLLV